MISFRERVEGEEILDLGTAERPEVERSLADLRRLNRYLGGWDGLKRCLLPRILAQARDPARRHRIRVLDVGTGGADLPLWLAAWARRRDLDVCVIGLDLKRLHLRIARARTRGESGVALVQADVSALPFRPGTFDYVYTNHFLHHFAPDAAVRQLRALFSLAKRTLIVMDGVRSPWPYYFLQLLAPLVARSPITRSDGAVSIRRAYRPPELEQLAQKAGLRTARVSTFFPWRQALIADRDADHRGET